MSTFHGEDPVQDYLRRLDAAVRQLPPERRRELVEEIRAHIDAARERGEALSPAGLRNVLDRLGTPEDIAAAAAETGAGSELDRPKGGRAGLLHEYAAVVALTLGSILLPVIGWAGGVLLLWTSTRWTTREKVLGTLVVPGGLGGVWLATAWPTQTCSESSGGTPSGQVVSSHTCSGFTLPTTLGIPLVIAALVAAFVVPAVLLARVRRRAGQTPPVGRWGAPAVS